MSILDAVNRRIAKFKEDQERREERRLGRLKSKEARETERAKITKARLKRDKDIARAQTATRTAQLAARKAKRKLDALGSGGSFGQFMSEIWHDPDAPRRKPTRRSKKGARKTIKRRTREKRRGK